MRGRDRHGDVDDAGHRRGDALGSRFRAGVGSGVLSSMRQVGGSLGIAVMGTIVASGMSSSLRRGDPPQIAYLHGFRHALNVAALLALTGAIVALATIRNNTSQPTPGQSRTPSTRAPPAG
jgi:hypothetical protein